MADSEAGNPENMLPQAYSQNILSKSDYSQSATHAHDSDGETRRQLPFTLDEALPFTPFTSVFPFESDIIHNPTIGSGQTGPSLVDHVQRADFEALNKEAATGTQSKLVERCLEHVQNLLKPEKITDFEFKTTPKSSSLGRTAVPSIVDGLSPFAKLVYENTAVGHRYPIAKALTGASTPNAHIMPPRARNPSRKSEANRQARGQLQEDGSIRAQGQALPRSPQDHAQPQRNSIEGLKFMKPSPAAQNAQAVAQNKSRIEIHLPSRKGLEAAAMLYQSASRSQSHVHVHQSQSVPPAGPTHHSRPSQVRSTTTTGLATQSSPASKRQGTRVPLQTVGDVGLTPLAPQSPKPGVISIELPAPNFDTSQYAVVETGPDAPQHLSTKKRKRAELNDDEDLMDGGLSRRDLAHGTLKELQRCLQDIFDAEDKLSGQPHSSITYISDQEPTMTMATQQKVQKLLSKAVDKECFRLVPLDDLLRVYDLNEAAMKHAEGLDVKIDEGWNEVEVAMWLQQLPDIELGLRAARTTLTIMCGGREERQLYKEGLIQQALDLFRNVMEGIVVPMAELRHASQVFKLFSAQRKPIAAVFLACQRLFALMETLIKAVDLAETVVGTLEVASTRLIFVDNAHSEKDSVVGIQKFDSLRHVAMDMLCQVFLLNPSRRQGIFDDILTSLEKLDTNKRNNRQFKLLDGGSVQPVSALIMRLIQASAGKVDDSKEKSRGSMMQSLGSDENESPELAAPRAKGRTDASYTVDTEDSAAAEHSTAVQELKDLVNPLFETARGNASYVVSFIVKRAESSTKTGESPYRKLLDLFVEDFTTCLDSPGWPAAELLLRLLMYTMLHLVQNDKTAAPAKNMALELLGVMAACISKLRSHVRKMASGLEATESAELDTDSRGLRRWITELTSMALEGKFHPEKITGWLGPYRVVLEYLEAQKSEDPLLSNAVSYRVTEWAVSLCTAYDEEEQDDPDAAEYGRNAFRLRNMIEDRRWLTKEYSFKAVAANHAKLSHSILLLRSPFCDAFKGILNLLMRSMTTDSATVRSRSLKSINQVLETDPGILDGDSVVIQLILQCSADSSPQVRDSALGLIGKCIDMRPALEERMTATIIQRFHDFGIGVRKRAMKLARDIYLRNSSNNVRSEIANGLLLRVQDPDESVCDLARQMMEEVWIAPFYQADDSTSYKQSLTDHVALMVNTVKLGNSALTLEKVLQAILSPKSRLAGANSRVCARLVASMFDFVDDAAADESSGPTGKDALQVLMIFAKADAKLFTFEQIRLLQPRIASVGTSEDLAVSRAALVIYRRVLPQLSSLHAPFLREIRKSLMPAVSKVLRLLMDDVMACLWIISTLLKSSEALARLVCSSLTGIEKVKTELAKNSLDDKWLRMFKRYSLIVGMAGKHCDLDSHEELFKKEPALKWKGGSVSKLMVDAIIPFAAPTQQVAETRVLALDAVGLICQSNPRNYVAANVYNTFQRVFDERNAALESMVLRSFKEFLLAEEQRSERAAADASTKGPKDSAKRDLKVMGGTTFDDVASATTQRFLKEITRITMASQDEHAFLAMEVLTSINRQGLVHPKETGVTLITLETCPVARISELAYQEHRVQHQKHETVIEREYVKAVQSAYHYQRDVIGDSHGATTEPFMSKLHLLIDVLKISKPKNRQRFLEKFVGQVDFDPAKLDVKLQPPRHVEFSRFLVENLAFFEYVTVGDLLATVTAIEKVVSGTGSGLAQSIESEVFEMRVDTVLGSQQPIEGDGQTAAPSAVPAIEPSRLRQLTAGSMVLICLWEARSYLRKLYGLAASPNRRESKTKAAAKDLTKAPTKVHGVTGDKFWEDVASAMRGLDSEDRMHETCRAFVELLNVDKDFKISDEDEEPGTDEAEGEDDADAISRKRKAANTPGGKKKRARSHSKLRSRAARKSAVEAWPEESDEYDEDDQ